jgi:hypothetical protein
MAEPPPDYFGDYGDDDLLEPFATEILNVRMICDKNDTENEDNDGNDDSRSTNFE